MWDASSPGHDGPILVAYMDKMSVPIPAARQLLRHPRYIVYSTTLLGYTEPPAATEVSLLHLTISVLSPGYSTGTLVPWR